MNMDNHLFSDYDWFSVQRYQLKMLEEAIADWDENRLLNTSVEDLCEYFVKEYRIDVPILDRDEIIVAQRETEVDVSRDPSRIIIDRSQPVYVSGTEIEVAVPFTGDSQAFRITPTVYSSSPRVAMSEMVLLLSLLVV